jgi:coenzyme F420-reducing hydrogenase delta subunit
LFKNLMEHMGIEPGRLQFSWISSAESTKFVEVVTQVTAAIKVLGPNSNFAKKMAEVA